MATFTFRKADPNDPRDIGFEIEDAGAALALTYSCRADPIDWSADDAPIAWVRVALHGGSDMRSAGDWYLSELARRGIVVHEAPDLPTCRRAAAQRSDHSVQVAHSR